MKNKINLKILLILCIIAVLLIPVIWLGTNYYKGQKFKKAIESVLYEPIFEDMISYDELSSSVFSGKAYLKGVRLSSRSGTYVDLGDIYINDFVSGDRFAFNKLSLELNINTSILDLYQVTRNNNFLWALKNGLNAVHGKAVLDLEIIDNNLLKIDYRHSLDDIESLTVNAELTKFSKVLSGLEDADLTEDGVMEFLYGSQKDISRIIIKKLDITVDNDWPDDTTTPFIRLAQDDLNYYDDSNDNNMAFCVERMKDTLDRGRSTLPVASTFFTFSLYANKRDIDKLCEDVYKESTGYHYELSTDKPVSFQSFGKRSKLKLR